MASAIMAVWAPGAACLGPARLDGFRLAFLRRSVRWRAGAADVVEAAGHAVWGVLYAVDEAHLEALDGKEFHGTGYRRRHVEVRCAGARCRAVTYEVIEKEPGHLAPRADYVDLLVAGAVERGLPEDWVQRLPDMAKGAP